MNINNIFKLLQLLPFLHIQLHVQRKEIKIQYVSGHFNILYNGNR